MRLSTMKTLQRRSLQGLRRALPTAEGPRPWRKAALRIAVTLALLSSWLALAHWLRALSGEQAAAGDLISRISWIYLKHWPNITWLGAFWCVAFWGLAPLWRAMQSPRFSDGVVGAAKPSALGAIRALTCGILLIMTLQEDLASTALLPRSMINPLGFMELLHLLPIRFAAFLASETALWAFQRLTELLLVLGVLGLGTRVAIPAAAICYFVLAGILRGYSFMYHGGLFPLYVLAVLAFTRCGQGWSLDRAWRTARGKSVSQAHLPTAYFGWARYVVWAVIALPYMAASGSKLLQMGIGWASADNMRWVMLRPTLELIAAGHDFDAALWMISAPDALLVLLAVFTLALQLSFGLVLVSRRARLILPAAAIGFHVGVLVLMNILFIDLILLHLVFYDWSSLRRWLATRRRATRRRQDASVPEAAISPEPHRRPQGAQTLGVGMDAAIGRSTETHRRGAFAALAIILFLASWWATQINLYPLTPVAMFTAQRGEAVDAGLVSYLRAIAHYEDGASGRAPFERWLPGMRAGRWRPTVRGIFQDAEGLAKGKQFLDAMIQAANAAGDGPRLSSLELQLWQWKFREAPNGPLLTDRYIHLAE